MRHNVAHEALVMLQRRGVVAEMIGEQRQGQLRRPRPFIGPLEARRG